jgi:hypothetical protein
LYSSETVNKSKVLVCPSNQEAIVKYKSILILSAAVLATANPVPAFAQSIEHNRYRVASSQALKWELAYLSLSAIDTVQTVSCLNKGTCTEANPVFGKNPTGGKIILTKVVGGAAHYLLFDYLRRRNPVVAKRAAQMSVGLQAGAVLWNASFAF